MSTKEKTSKRKHVEANKPSQPQQTNAHLDVLGQYDGGPGERALAGDEHIRGGDALQRLRHGRRVLFVEQDHGLEIVHIHEIRDGRRERKKARVGTRVSSKYYFDRSITYSSRSRELR